MTTLAPYRFLSFEGAAAALNGLDQEREGHDFQPWRSELSIHGA
jgi:hypothetical protein